jgi:hypothetical protein
MPASTVRYPVTSRKNAMLTTEDRRWLTGEKTYEGQHARQQRYQRRNDIRERVYNSVLDFTILFDELEEDERQKIFGTVTDEGRRWVDTDREFRAGVRDALAFFLRGVGIAALMRGHSSAEAQVPSLLLRSALARAGRRDGLVVEATSLDVDATEVAVPEVLERLEAGDELDPTELYLLMESGAVDPAVVQDCLRPELVGDEVGGE